MKNNIKPDRTAQPAVVIPETVDVEKAVQKTLSNGAKLYTIECPEKSVVRFSFVFGAGTSWQDVPFSASATLNTLGEGSKKLNSHQIAEQLDFYGSYFDVNIDRDWSVVTFVCLSKFFDETVRIAEEILIHPQFPEKEVRTYCDKSRQNLIINRTKVDFSARERFAKAIFGPEHPYAVSYDASLYDNLTGEDLRRFYAKNYIAGNCFVVMSGNTGDKYVTGVEKLMEMLPGGNNGLRKAFPETVSKKYDFMPFDNAVQSSIRIGKVLFPRSHPDYIGMQVVAAILGGYFGARLIHNLREEHGYTYGAYATMINFDRSGYFAAATEVGSQFTEPAVKEMFFEIERLRNEPVSTEELSLVKNIMVGEVMRILDGPFGIADVTIENIQNGFDNSYIDEFVRTVRECTPERVTELARKYLAADSLTTVIAGVPTVATATPNN